MANKRHSNQKLLPKVAYLYHNNDTLFLKVRYCHVEFLLNNVRQPPLSMRNPLGKINKGWFFFITRCFNPLFALPYTHIRDEQRKSH